MDKDYYNRLAELAVEDDAAFTELYEKFFPRVYGMIFARLKDTSAADDVVNEIFMKVALNLDKYNKKSAFSTWLFTIAQNTLTDYFRWQSRNREDSWDEFLERAAPIDEQPEEKLLSDETIENLLRAVGKLSERQRRIIELKYWADLSNVEIAEMLNLSASNVGYIHYQAIKKLRELMTA